MKIDSLVNTEWLAAHLDDPDLVVLDCTVSIEADTGGAMRPVSGRVRYDEAHVRGAGFADLIHPLSDPESPLAFAMPTPIAFCTAMGALGVGDRSRVVLYDATISAWAARVWWMLRWVGFDHAAILDGGLRAWIAEGRPTSTEPTRPAPAVLTPRLRPELVAEREEVRAAVGDAEVQLVDALPAGHFRGETQMYHRPGHIPGACNVCAVDLIDEAGRYRPLADLSELHRGDPAARTITYCGGGIAASSNAFVLTSLGFSDVAVYAASLQEWAADPTNPLTVDDS
jgi:thiosulfate/3-mercaptopyruvate sulfurtransferase